MSRSRRTRLIAVVVLLLVVGAVVALREQTPPPAPGQDGQPLERALRLQAAILLLRSTVTASDDLPATMDRWCAEHGLAEAGDVRVGRSESLVDHPDTAGRDALRVGGESLRYRQLTVTCGGHAVVRVQNWWAPARIPPETDHRLAAGDMLLPEAVTLLQPRHRTLRIRDGWQPLPQDWQIRRIDELRAWAARYPGTADRLDAGLTLFNRQVITTREVDNLPIALTEETYTGAALAFLAPPKR